MPTFSLGVLITPYRSTVVPADRRFYAALNELNGTDAHVLVAGRNPFSAGLLGKAETVTPFHGEIVSLASIDLMARALTREGITHITAVGGFENALLERLCLRICREIPSKFGDAARLYALDYSSFDFSKMGARRYRFSDPDTTGLLGHGWSKQEAFGVWSDGPTATLNLPATLSGQPIKTLIAKTIMLSPFGTGQTIRYSINGSVVQIEQAPAGSTPIVEKQIEISVPQSARATKNALEVTLEIERPTAPKQMGMNSDTRQLGLGLIQIVADTR